MPGLSGQGGESIEVSITEIIPGKDTLLKNVFSKQGILLLRAGTKLTREYKKLLQKQVKKLRHILL